MKKLIVILMFPMSAFAQDFKIYVCKDIMTDKEYAFPSETILCSDDGVKGFNINLFLSNKNGVVSYNGLLVNVAGVGKCSEKDELYFLFDDDTKVAYKSWNDFNCEGRSYFDLYAKWFDDLSKKKIKAIRFKNGRTSDSFTYVLNESQSTFFIRAKKCIDSKVYIQKDCNN
jgi:hypothetical protein